MVLNFGNSKNLAPISDKDNRSTYFCQKGTSKGDKQSLNMPGQHNYINTRTKKWKKWFLSRKLRTLLYGEGNKINNKSCNHWLVIKLCVINDICQAIACGFDYFHCMFNSQVAPLSFLWLIVIKQANHTFLICTLYLCKRWIYTLLYCVTSGIGLSYDLLGLIWELQLTLTTRYPPSNLIWKYLLNSQSSTKTNKLITCSTRLMNPQVTVCICRIYFDLCTI